MRTRHSTVILHLSHTLAGREWALGLRKEHSGVRGREEWRGSIEDPGVEVNGPGCVASPSSTFLTYDEESVSKALAVCWSPRSYTAASVTPLTRKQPELALWTHYNREMHSDIRGNSREERILLRVSGLNGVSNDSHKAQPLVLEEQGQGTVWSPPASRGHIWVLTPLATQEHMELGFVYESILGVAGFILRGSCDDSRKFSCGVDM